MRVLRLLAFVALLAACAKQPMTTPKKNNELILIGGTVAVGPQQTPQKNVAIFGSDGVIGDIGSPDAIRKAHPNTNEIGAINATVLHGLKDAHGHLKGLGL